MMREIKFRAWDGINIVEVVTLHLGGTGLVVDIWKPTTEGGYRLVNMTWVIPLMQYTGLKDKNGKDIYEGDLIQNEFGRICEVVWFESAGCWDAKVVRFSEEGGHLGFLNNEWPCCVEVVGNIYENPV